MQGAPQHSMLLQVCDSHGAGPTSVLGPWQPFNFLKYHTQTVPHIAQGLGGGSHCGRRESLWHCVLAVIWAAAAQAFLVGYGLDWREGGQELLVE